MERFNRLGMDLITPGGVGQPERLQTEGGTTTFLVSWHEQSKVENPQEAHHSGARIQKWTKTKGKYLRPLDDTWLD